METLNEVQKHLPIRWPIQPDNRMEEIKKFIDITLNHSPIIMATKLVSLAKEVDAEMVKLSNNPYDNSSASKLDHIYRTIEGQTEEIYQSMVLDQLTKAISQKWRLDAIQSDKSSESTGVQWKLHEAYRSPSKPVLCFMKHRWYTMLSYVLKVLAPEAARRSSMKAKKYDPNRFSPH